MYNDHKQSGHLSTKLQAKKYTYPHFFTWVTVLSTDQRLISNFYNDYIQSGRLSTNLKAKKYIYPVFLLESQYYLQINTWFQICTMIINSQDTYQQIYKRKNIHPPIFWLESQYYLQINAWFQKCTIIIQSQDTYQQIYKQKNIYTPVFDLSHSTIYKSTPDFKYVQWS